MYEPESTEVTSATSFFDTREKQDRIKKEALKNLEKYVEFSSLTFSVDTSQVEKKVFLKPIKEIFATLGIHLNLPVEADELQLSLFSGKIVSHANWALESISFIDRLQQAVVKVEQVTALTAVEYMGLYWQFLYPLYKNCKRMIDTSFWPENPLAEMVHWLNSYEAGEATEISAEILQQSRQPILTSLAYTLIDSYLSAAPAELRNQALSIALKSYEQLHSSLQFDLITLMKSHEIAKWARIQYPEENSVTLFSSLLKTFSYYRNKDGSNVQQSEYYQSWLNLVNKIIAPIAVKDETVSQRSARTDDIRIVMRDLRKMDPKQIHQAKVVEYRICPEFYEQLFEKNAEGKWSFKPRENLIGRHTVYPIKIAQDGSRPDLWVKLFPEQAGIEFGIGNLSKRLGLDGVVPGVVGNVRLNGKDTGQAVWISADVGWQESPENVPEIKTLSHAMKEDTEKLKCISKDSFTRTMLRVLITNPEDDKGNDYWLIKTLENEYDLIRIDNERAFFQIEKQAILGRLSSPTVLQVKSSIYCLPQMQENLDSQVLEDFAKLDMYQVLNAWLSDLKLEHRRYPNLFTEMEVRQHFPEQSEDISILAIMLTPKLMLELLGRLQLIQHIVRDILSQGESLTGLTLLGHVQPLLVNKGQKSYYYAEALKKYPDPNHAQARFEYLTQTSYPPKSSKNALKNDQSMTSPALAAQQSLRLEQPLTIEDVLASLDERNYSPKQAKKQLKSLAKANASQIWRDLLQGEPLLQKRAMAAFSELPIKQRATLIIQTSHVLMKDPTAYTLKQQEIILEAIATANWQRLTLTAFARTLTPALFGKIMAKTADSLVHLDISKCIQISEDQIRLIASSCYLLESLAMNDLLISKLIIKQVNGGKIFLPKLNLLKVNEGINIETVFLELPALQLLEAKNCAELTDIKVIAAGAARAKLIGCEKLTFNTLKSILALTTICDEKCFKAMWIIVRKFKNLEKNLEKYAKEEIIAVMEENTSSYVKNFYHKGYFISYGNRLVISDDSNVSGEGTKQQLLNAEAIILAHLPIKKLNLNGFMIADDIMKKLSGILQQNKTIDNIDLSNNLFRGEGLSWVFGVIANNQNIQAVALKETPFFYKQIRPLVEQLAKCAPSDREILIEASLYQLADPNIDDKLMTSKIFLPPENRKIILSFTLSKKIKDFFPGSETYYNPIGRPDALSGFANIILFATRKSYYPSSPLFIKENPLLIKKLKSEPSPQIDFSFINDHITILNLSDRNIDDKTIEQLITIFQQYTSLKIEKLILSKNAITSKGLKLLAEHILPKLPSLVQLDLAKNNFDQYGLRHILKALNQHDIPLKRLNLSGNPIGDAGIAILATNYFYNTELEFLGLRNTSFTENVGYISLLSLVKKNLNLLDVDIRGNLLLLPQAHTELEKYLRRNKKIQPNIQLLIQKKPDYPVKFFDEAKSLIPLLGQEKIENLNKIISFLSYLEEGWEMSIQFAFQNVKSVLKKEGGDQEHPLLAYFNDVETKKRHLREGYDLLLQKMASTPEKWQENRITIRIWKPGSFKDDKFVVEKNVVKNMVGAAMTGDNVGHVSVETKDRYISFWPGKEEDEGTKKYFSFNTKMQDEKKEGPDASKEKGEDRLRTADIIIVLYSLGITDLEAYFHNIRGKYTYSMLPGIGKKVANCATFALKMLIKGGIQYLLPKEQWPARAVEHGFSEFHPLYIASLVAKIKKIEVRRYPFTKKFNPLHHEEEVPGQTRENAIKPDIKTQEKYSQTHFFAAIHSPNMKVPLADRWETTKNPIYFARESYTSAHDYEISFVKEDLLQDLTERLQDSEESFKEKFPDKTGDRNTRKHIRPGWVLHQYKQYPAIATVVATIPNSTLLEGMELKIIGKNGDLEDPNLEVVCQEERSPDNLVRHTLQRGQIKFK